jgi:hypothetical protein
MFTFRRFLRHSHLAVLVVLCLAALTATSVFAGGVASPLRATDVLGSPDAAVNGKFAVGSASVGSKALTVTGVIDFLGAGTVHNYFSQGGGNNMQINTNVDEANTVGDATKSQWKLVLGSSLDQFSIRRSPASGTYNEDALFFIDGSSGSVGIATVDTGNGASIPFTPQARLHVQTDSGDAVRGQTASSSGSGVFGFASATTGANHGVYGVSDSTNGRAVEGYAPATTGISYGVLGWNSSTSGRAVVGVAYASTGTNYGVYGSTNSPSGYGVYYVGGLAGTGTKSAIVDTQDYGWRSLYAMESPQNWFEDFGQAALSAGEAVVPIEPIFAQTVNLQKPYHVFLTPLGSGCTLYVADKSSTTFTVRANEGAGCEIAFDYRIIAPRLDYEDLRLKPATDPQAVAASLSAAPPEPISP